MITGNNDRWSALSMKEKADLFKLYAAEGINSLDKIREHYNSLGRPNPQTLLQYKSSTQKFPAGNLEMEV